MPKRPEPDPEPSDEAPREEPPPEPRIVLPGSEKGVSVRKAQSTMRRLTEEAADLREDDSTAAKTRRIEIARQLRAIQNQIDKLDEEVVIEIPASASKQFPFRIGSREFWPGVHRVRGQIAMTLRYMMAEHGRVENHRIVAGGNIQPDATGLAAYGKELPAL